jgi:hypothetical protein
MIRQHGRALAAILLALPVLLLFVQAGPARADGCADGWWCFYSSPSADMAGTNNTDDDWALTDRWEYLHTQTNEVLNLTNAYLGLYRSTDFTGMFMCLAPYTEGKFPAGMLAAVKAHSTKDEACGAPVHPSAPGPVIPGGHPSGSTSQHASPHASHKPAGTSQSPGPMPTLTPTAAQPSQSAQLPMVAGGFPPMPGGATVIRSRHVAASSSDGTGGKVALIVAIAIVGGVLAALAALAATLLRGRNSDRNSGGSESRSNRSGGRLWRSRSEPDDTAMIDRALRLLAVDCEQEQREVPALERLSVEETSLVLHLGQDDLDAPIPWKAEEERVWRLAISDVAELTGDTDLRAPYPMLVPIDTDQGLMWVNLAASPGLIGLTGSARSTRRLVRAMAGALRSNPWSADVQVRMIGFDVEFTGFTPDQEGEPEDERGRVVFLADTEVGRPVTLPPGCVAVVLGQPETDGWHWKTRRGGRVRSDAWNGSRPAVR